MVIVVMADDCYGDEEHMWLLSCGFSDQWEAEWVQQKEETD